MRPPTPRVNAQTEQLAPIRPNPPDLRRAYAFARAVGRAPDAGRPGYRFVWTRGEMWGSTLVAAQEDAFGIFGRHTQCDAVLRDDPFVSLRHVLVRVIPLPSGGIAARVLDLHTDAGFVLTDGSRQTSIFAEGPIAIAIGDYALIGLPNEKDDLPNELPLPYVETPSVVRDQIAALEQAMSPYRANARPSHVSRVTLMPRLVMLGEPIPPRLGRLATGGRWLLSLVRDGRSATHTISDDDLHGGVVIGRSEKCHSEALRRITDTSTSRVHVLVLREGDGIFGYDLASTQGTFLRGMPVRRAALGDACELTLGRGSRAVRMRWQAA